MCLEVKCGYIRCESGLTSVRYRHAINILSSQYGSRMKNKRNHQKLSCNTM